MFSHDNAHPEPDGKNEFPPHIFMPRKPTDV